MNSLLQRHTRRLFAPAVIALSGLAGVLAAGVARVAPESMGLAVAGLIALLPLIGLGLARYGLLVGLAFATLGVVRWEPAPVDLLLPLLLALGVLGGQLSLAGLRGSALIHVCLWIFVLLSLLGIFRSDDVAYSLRYTLISVYLIGLAYFVKLYVTSAERMRVIMLGYVTAALGSVALVYLELSGLSGTSELFVLQQRALGLFKDANVFAPFLVLPIVFLLDELLRPRLIPGYGALKLLAIVLLSGGLFLAFSRAAWANLALALVVYLALMAPSLTARQWARLAGPALVGAVVIGGVIVQLNLVEFLLWRATPLQSYDAGRFGTQAAGIVAGLSNPFGIGPGMLFYAHSLYIRTFAEYGLLGLLALGTCLGVTFAGCLGRALRADDRVFGLSARVVTATYCGLLFNSVVIDSIHWRHFWIVFALAWVIAFAGPAPARRAR